MDVPCDINDHRPANSRPLPLQRSRSCVFGVNMPELIHPPRIQYSLPLTHPWVIGDTVQCTVDGSCPQSCRKEGENMSSRWSVLWLKNTSRRHEGSCDRGFVLGCCAGSIPLIFFSGGWWTCGAPGSLCASRATDDAAVLGYMDTPKTLTTSKLLSDSTTPSTYR